VRPHDPKRALRALAMLCAGFACAMPAPAPLDASERSEYARLSLERARALRAEGELGEAERVLRGVIAVDPGNPRARAMRSEILTELGRSDEAEREGHLARGSQAPLPTGPLDLSSRGVLVAIAGSELSRERTLSYLAAVQEEFALALAGRVALRLPEAKVVTRVPASVAEARAWLGEKRPRAVLGLRGARAFCGESSKDGRFAVAQLDGAVAVPGAELERFSIRKTLYDLDPTRCESELASRLLEEVLAHPEVRAGLAAPEPPAAVAWSGAALRALFPGLEGLVVARTETGHEAMAKGRFEEALRHFDEAARLDPEDTEVEAYRRETETTLALQRELRATPRSFVGDAARAAERARRRGATDGAALRTLLRQAAPHHEQLFAVLDARTLPAPRPGDLAPTTSGPGDPDAVAAKLARASAQGPVVWRSAPSAASGVRVWFAAGGATPLLVEQDSDRDGRADRWIGYRAGSRRDLWEDGNGLGAPDLHVVFAPSGASLERVEIDDDADGRPERVLAWIEGRLASEARDSDADGVLDRFDLYDDGGALRLREEDRDGDGTIDVRTRYRDGRLVAHDDKSVGQLP
jgi:Flp pilus assembly protein TadD